MVEEWKKLWMYWNMYTSNCSLPFVLKAFSLIESIFTLSSLNWEHYMVYSKPYRQRFKHFFGCQYFLQGVDILKLSIRIVSGVLVILLCHSCKLFFGCPIPLITIERLIETYYPFHSSKILLFCMELSCQCKYPGGRRGCWRTSSKFNHAHHVFV